MRRAAYTTIINSGGQKYYYSFLPPHGFELPTNAAVCYRGEVVDRFIPSWPHHRDPDRPPNPRKVKALRDAEMAGQLQTYRSPAPQHHAKMTSVMRKVSTLGQIDPHHNNIFRKE